MPPQFIPPAPGGFILVGPPLEIRSTALAPQAIIPCIRPPFGEFAERLFFWDQFQWVDRTNTVNTATSEVCGHPGPVGTFALARPDLPLSLTITPQSATADIVDGHVAEVIVSDQSNPDSRVTFVSSSPLTVEFRDPGASNSPLSFTPQFDQRFATSGTSPPMTFA